MTRYHILVRRRILLASFLTLAALSSACSSTSDPPATLVILSGQETDAFTRAPVPDHVTVRAVDLNGNASDLVSVPWPAESFDIGDLNNSQIAAFQASLDDAASTPLLFGQSVYYALGSLSGYEIPLFVGRTGAWSRPTGALPVARSRGVVGVIGAEFLVFAGGDNVLDTAGDAASSASIAAYDLAAWDAVDVSLELPRSPASMPVVLNEYALLINADGATWFDFATYDQAEATAPDGMTFADLAGGQVVYSADGVAYVVAGTRGTEASDAVLRVGTDLSLTPLHLRTPRRGASAVWTQDRGLVVLGGSDAGAGVEVLADDASEFVELAFPADATEGAGAAVLASDRLIVAGGKAPDNTAAPSRSIDLSCASSCAAGVVQAPLPLPSHDVSAYVVGSDAVLVIGEETLADATQRTAAYLLEGLGTTPSLTEVPLREPRSGAISIALMGDMVAVAGGYDSSSQPVRSIEVFPGK